MQVIENHHQRRAPSRTGAFIRFIDKSPEEQDEEVEYDMDEEVSSLLS